MAMGTEETNQFLDKVVSEDGGVTVIKNREEFGSNVLFHTVAALVIWLGTIHFNVFLVLFSLLFLPFSRTLLFVLPQPFATLTSSTVYLFIWVLKKRKLFSSKIGCCSVCMCLIFFRYFQVIRIASVPLDRSN